jgi:hypothetical protein
MEIVQTKSTFLKLFLAFVFFGIASCTENENSEDNSPPSLFEITLDEVSASSATISWTESVDPEGSTVFYDVFLNGTKTADNITDLFFTFSDLDENADYTVEVIASDPEGNERSAESNFSTSENQPPSIFNITIVSNDPFYSRIEWTVSIDPEGTNVTYGVYLNNELIEGNLNELDYVFQGLRGLETYQVRIEAKDGDGKITNAQSTLTTAIKIHEGTLTLGNQDMVEAYGQAGYNQINGNLNIGSLQQNITNVSDLSSLSSLIEVDGDLNIKNTICQSLIGLENIDLTSNWPKLKIENNSNLINLQGLNSISKGHEVNIALNENLVSLDGLDSLQTVTDFISIVANPNLTSTSGLSELSFVGFSINIYNNDSLINLEGFEGITSTTSSVDVCCNENLTSLKGLENLTSSSALIVADNHSLVNLSYLSNVTDVYSLIITDNPVITDLSGLENLVDVNHTINIARNDNLNSLNGIQNVIFSDNQANYHELIISQNNSLSNLDPLSNYYYDRGKVIISQNTSLTDLCGISYLVLNMTDFMNYFNFAIGNAYNPGIVQMQNGNCSL